ncbi:hypothetical protein T484DRAFT_3236711 [Baffinella frigidus]|nr:hypothetical protein T484DRAFT_3236711 [Cryptophyta sp. CCMP2293]
MRVYVHFDEEEPSHTAALSAGDGETLRDLVERFIAQYLERFGEDAVALHVDSVQMRNSKKKKLKPDAALSSQLTDKEDVFIIRAPAASGFATRRPASLRSQGSGLSPMASSPQPPRATAPPPVAPAREPAMPPPLPAASKLKAPAELPDEVSTPMGSAEAELAELAAGMGKEELASLAACLGKEDQAKLAELLGNTHMREKFMFAQDRPAAVPEDDAEIELASHAPTHFHNVQANCCKCGQHIFYKAEAAFLMCHSCRFLHTGAECTTCGTFFPAASGSSSVKCPVCSASGDTAAFQACRARSFTDDASTVPQASEPNEIHLIMQYYIDKSEERREEVKECMRQNMANPMLRHVHVLTEEPMDLDEFQRGDKLVQYVQGSWLSYVDAIQYAHRFLRNKVVILANADVHFDKTLEKVVNLDLRGRALALTRFDVKPQGLAFNPGAAPISQDAWIFRAPLPGTLQNVDFKLGKPGCDNRFAFELRVAGLRVTNPCFSITVSDPLHTAVILGFAGTNPSLFTYLPGT